MSNAVNIALLCDTTYAWINSRKVVDSQSIILEDPNVRRPEKPYVSFRFLTGPAMVGTTDSRVNNDADDNVDVSGPRRISLSVKAYGRAIEDNEALQIMSNLHDSLQLREVTDLFNAKNMAVWGQAAPVDISAELETGIENRASMDVIFGVTSIQVEDGGAIETVIIKDAVLSDVDGTTVQTINETITKP